MREPLSKNNKELEPKGKTFVYNQLGIESGQKIKATWQFLFWKINMFAYHEI
jgi:hypothetical protein